jgi:hypothetical protein
LLAPSFEDDAEGDDATWFFAPFNAAATLAFATLMAALCANTSSIASSAVSTIDSTLANKSYASPSSACHHDDDDSDGGVFMRMMVVMGGVFMMMIIVKVFERLS